MNLSGTIGWSFGESLGALLGVLPAPGRLLGLSLRLLVGLPGWGPVRTPVIAPMGGYVLHIRVPQ